MTDFRNTFDSSKSYEFVRMNFGQKPVSSEINELQSITQHQLFCAMDTLFDSGFIYAGFSLISGDYNNLHISAGYLQLDGFARFFDASILNLSSLTDSIVDIWADLYYTNITFSDDSDITHPEQPDLPVADRQKAHTILRAVDPDTLTAPTAFISRVKAKILRYNRNTGELTKLVTNANKFMNLSNIPGKLQPGQIAPGAISADDLTLLVDGIPLKDALALRMDDASGSFLASGGAISWVDNSVSGPRIRIEAFRAYIQGFLTKYDRDRIITLDPTSDTKTRANETKTYNTGTLTYSLSLTPASSITALDGDVSVSDENVTRGSGTSDLLLNTPVESITSVVQGVTTFIDGVDYELSGDRVSWLVGGSSPSNGTTYQVTYVYRRAFVIPTDVALDTDKNSITFTGTHLPVNTTSFQVTYQYYLPRIDSLVVDKAGNINVLKGVPADYPKAPITPTNLFELAEINLPPGTQLGDTFLGANGYTVPGASSISYRTVQIVASKMRDHQKRYEDLQNLAFNSIVDTATSYLSSKDTTLTKLGVFADGFYDDRLSDYGQTTQNMVFNSELQQGEGARTSWVQPLTLTDAVNAPTNGKYHNKAFTTLDYTEEVEIDQSVWSDLIDLQPFAEVPLTRRIEVPNTNLIAGQTLTIKGFNWDYGENQIQFFVNDEQLTGITIVTGSAGAASDSVIPDSNRSFVVTFTVPDTIPIGYRLVRARSAVTDNEVTVLVGMQTASTPLPAFNGQSTPPDDDRPCGETRLDIRSRRVRKRRPGRWRSYGVYQQFDCDLNRWVDMCSFDPIIQTFTPSRDEFISAVDVWFTAKDPKTSVYVSVVLTRDGEPDTQAGRIGTAQVNPSSIVTNGNPTKISFNNPVFVQGGQKYGIMLESPTTGYKVMYAKLGGLDRTQYVTGQGTYRTFTSASSNPIGDYVTVTDSSKRDRDTTHRFVYKQMLFTPTENITVFHLDAPVYIGPDAGRTVTTPSTNVSPTIDQITFATAHGLSTGERVLFSQATTDAGGLISGKFYYARAVTDKIIALHNSEDDAVAAVNRINITSAGSGDVTITAKSSAVAVWELYDVTTSTVIWTTNRTLTFDFNDIPNMRTGSFTAEGYEKEFIPDPGNTFPKISLVANHQYRFKVSADQSAPYKYLRDDYQDDHVLNGQVIAFTTATPQFEYVSQNALTDGVLFASPDNAYWVGDPSSDLRFRLYRCVFTTSPAVYNYKQFKTSPGAGEVTLTDSITHFTTMLNAVAPKGVSVLIEYTTDGGTTWTPHVPVVFKQLEFNNDTDRETWSFFNFGFFSGPRFQEEQIDPQFVPSAPNKDVALSALSTQIDFRLTLSTADPYLSPVIDMTNWAIFFEKFGLQTIYFSRTLELQSDVAGSGTPAKVFVWSTLPSGVTQSCAITLDGDNGGSPTYATKSSPSSSRVLNASTGLIEYEYDFSSSDLSGQAERRHPKVRLTWDTSNRYAQPIVKRVGFTTF